MNRRRTRRSAVAGDWVHEKPWVRISSKMAEEVEFVSDEDVPELRKRRENGRGAVHFVDHHLVYPLYER